MSKRTPLVEKVRKSTPKTVPKKLINTPTNMDVTIDLKRASFRRNKRDLDDAASLDIASICTPTRTTRSMSRHGPGDMGPPIPPFVTPSKRKTIATPKSSAKKISVAEEPENASAGEFVRPRTPKIKINDVTLADDSINEPVVPMLKLKRNNAKTHKLTDASEKPAVSSEDDMASVTVEKSSAKKVAKMRGRKSNKSINDAESTDDESMLSVSKLGQDLNSSTKKAAKSVRGRKSIASNNGVVSTDDEDLPSVSILAEGNSPGRYARSPKWLEENSNVSNQNDSVLNSSKASARKSIETEDATAHPESNENASNDENDEHNKPSNVALATEAAIENGCNTDLEPVAAEPKPTRRSKQKVMEQTESSDDALPSVSFLGTQLKSARKSMKRKTELGTESPAVKRTVKFTSPVFIEPPKIDLDASYGSDKRNDSQDIAMQSPADEPSQNGDQKPAVKKNRMSIIDLTESPVNTNRTLNTTFSPKVEPASEPNEAMNHTFTEEENKEALDKTFSPVPSSASALPTYSTPMLVLASPSIPVSTKKSPLLKRLKGTPMRKPAHNLNTPGKLSSAKKTKMLETAKDLCGNSSAKKLQIKAPKMNSSSTPKLFRFGDDTNNKNVDFRFSLLPPSLNPNLQQSNREYTRISTPKPRSVIDLIVSLLLQKNPRLNPCQTSRISMVVTSKKPNQLMKHAKAARIVPNCYCLARSRLLLKVSSFTSSLLEFGFFLLNKIYFDQTGQAQKAEKAITEKKIAAAEKKIAAAAAAVTAEKNIVAAKKAEESLRAIEKKREIKNQVRRPLGHVNRARLNDEQRQELRLQQFKQTKRQSIGKKKNDAASLSGVRLNRRFELLMQMRKK